MALRLNETSITSNIVEGLETMLNEELIDNVSDDAKVGLIRAGLLQADPTIKKINILIHPGGEDWPDMLNTNKEGPDMFGPTYTIGGEFGSSFWRRRFRIQLDMFFTRESDRENARKKAQLVVARAHSALVKWDIGKNIELKNNVKTMGYWK